MSRDTLVETKQVVDTMVVERETTVPADTTRVGDQGVISVDTTKAQ